ncbi:hypothetical protein MMC25_004266 [Agyrium rufum]|nr:hypothetical protein [Agyrium rufum]
MTRNGTKGPEMGYEIEIGEDCWIGGNVVICPKVRIGKGSTVGAGSVVTKDVRPFTVVAGNPAKVLGKIETAMNPELESNLVDTANLPNALSGPPKE